MQEAMLKELEACLNENQIFVSEPMAKHTTFRIGGNADLLVKPSSSEQLQKILEICRTYEKDYYVIGNGSNLLVGDAGVRGIVIEFGNLFSDVIFMNQEKVRVQAGAMLSKVANLAMQQSLTGMEFAAGIPGTIGGAIMMNAGAYGGEMKDIVESVTMLTEAGELVTYTGDQMDFGYRHSIVLEEKMIVVETTLKLAIGEKTTIQARMQELADARREKQPLEYPSAGSTFKRPEGYFAGKLIQDAGLAGYHVGDAEVSSKHCGFVINRGNASARDVDKLMQDVIEKVDVTYGVRLEPEVRRLGEFEECL